MEEQGFVTPQIDKRVHRRAKLVTQVKCDALGRNEVLVTRDVSVGGLFISTKTPLPLESVAGIFFSVGYSSHSISCKGKVVYSMPGMGMGIEFMDLKDESRQMLQKFVDEAA
jgi:hypothetical protein